MDYFKRVKDFIYYERRKIIIVSILFIGVCILISFNYLKNSNSKIVQEDIIIEEKIEEEEVKEENIKYLIVDIKGEVNHPGCYKVESDSRVSDVVELAGGLTKDAYTDSINLSAKVFDEMVIVIDKKEANNIKIESDAKVEKKTNNKTDTKKTSGKVSINNATEKELMTLKGIGSAKAKSIIEYRNKNGAFKSIEELKKIKGIGDKIFESIKDSITL